MLYYWRACKPSKVLSPSHRKMVYDSWTLGKRKSDLDSFYRVQKHIPRAICTCCLSSERSAQNEYFINWHFRLISVLFPGSDSNSQEPHSLKF